MPSPEVNKPLWKQNSVSNYFNISPFLNSRSEQSPARAGTRPGRGEVVAGPRRPAPPRSQVTSGGPGIRSPPALPAPAAELIKSNATVNPPRSSAEAAFAPLPPSPASLGGGPSEAGAEFASVRVCVCICFKRGRAYCCIFRAEMTLLLTPLPACHSEGDRRTDTCHLNWASPCGSQAPYASWIGFCSWDTGLLHTGLQISPTELSPPTPALPATLRISKGMNKW